MKNEGWDGVNRKPGSVSEAERAEAEDRERQFDLYLAKMFNTHSGKKVWERWKRTILDRRIDVVMNNPVNGSRQGTPPELLFAKIGESNFVKDIQTRIERAKK